MALIVTASISERCNTVAFTGSRERTTDAPAIVYDMLATLDPAIHTIVTGGCVGVDALVAELAYNMGFRVYTVLPGDKRLVDPQHTMWAHAVEDAQYTYRQRNERMVVLSSRLFALPAHPEYAPQSQRSGTWQTVRMGRRAHAVAPVIKVLSETY